ncbi:unnamed protein product [Calicophoron daubneyi]|uniref:Uncharacterized protein n=1 Tax=Calicophoron daubneyi TaxID=300641 RepID=A0AAV2TA38_CALDB
MSSQSGHLDNFDENMMKDLGNATNANCVTTIGSVSNGGNFQLTADYATGVNASSTFGAPDLCHVSGTANKPGESVYIHRSSDLAHNYSHVSKESGSGFMLISVKHSRLKHGDRRAMSTVSLPKNTKTIRELMESNSLDSYSHDDSSFSSPQSPAAEEESANGDFCVPGAVEAEEYEDESYEEETQDDEDSTVTRNSETPYNESVVCPLNSQRLHDSADDRSRADTPLGDDDSRQPNFPFCGLVNSNQPMIPPRATSMTPAEQLLNSASHYAGDGDPILAGCSRESAAAIGQSSKAIPFVSETATTVQVQFSTTALTAVGSRSVQIAASEVGVAAQLPVIQRADASSASGLTVQQALCLSNHDPVPSYDTSNLNSTVGLSHLSIPYSPYSIPLPIPQQQVPYTQPPIACPHHVYSTDSSNVSSNVTQIGSKPLVSAAPNLVTGCLPDLQPASRFRKARIHETVEQWLCGRISTHDCRLKAIPDWVSETQKKRSMLEQDLTVAASHRVSCFSCLESKSSDISMAGAHYSADAPLSKARLDEIRSRFMPTPQPAPPCGDSQNGEIVPQEHVLQKSNLFSFWVGGRRVSGHMPPICPVNPEAAPPPAAGPIRSNDDSGNFTRQKSEINAPSSEDTTSKSGLLLFRQEKTEVPQANFLKNISANSVYVPDSSTAADYGPVDPANSTPPNLVDPSTAYLRRKRTVVDGQPHTPEKSRFEDLPLPFSNAECPDDECVRISHLPSAEQAVQNLPPPQKGSTTAGVGPYVSAGLSSVAPNLVPPASPMFANFAANEKRADDIALPDDNRGSFIPTGRVSSAAINGADGLPALQYDRASKTTDNENERRCEVLSPVKRLSMSPSTYIEPTTPPSGDSNRQLLHVTSSPAVLNQDPKIVPSSDEQLSLKAELCNGQDRETRIDSRLARLETHVKTSMDAVRSAIMGTFRDELYVVHSEAAGLLSEIKRLNAEVASLRGYQVAFHALRPFVSPELWDQLNAQLLQQQQSCLPDQSVISSSACANSSSSTSTLIMPSQLPQRSD